MHKEFYKRVNDIVKKYGNKTAITFMRENSKQDKLSFYQVKQFVENVEMLLNKKRIRRGDRVAIMMEHSPYPVLIGLALAYLNVTSVLIDASLPKKEKENLLLLADVRGFFTTKTQLREISEDIMKGIPCFFVDEWHIMEVNNSVENCLEKTIDPELDVIAILFSSGTTDQMKGIKITYSSVLKAREVFIRLSGLKDYMNYLLVLPFNHIAGFTGAMTYFLTGCELGFIENVNSNKLQEGLLKFQPYYFAMVPKVYEVIEQKIRAKIHEKGKVIEFFINVLLGLSGLIRKYFGINIGRKVFASITEQVFGKNIYGIGTGASPCKDSTTKFFLNLGLEWSNLYATTETSVPIVATGIQDRYPVGTIGKVDRHPEIEVKIINRDKDNVGEIAVKSELIMKGYFRKPELTEKAFENGYFKTGDYGFIDKKGYLHITGRIKESIVLRNGKKVSPSDVDGYYLERVQNINLASRGIVNEKEKYDEIHMFVENKEYSEYEKKRIIAALKENSRKAPEMYKIDKIHFINKIPITSVGKVKRFCLDIPKSDETKKSERGEKTRVSFSNIDNVDVIVSQIIKNIMNMADDVKLSQDAKIKADIGLDSLNCFEMCVAIEENFGVSIENKLSENMTVKDIVNYIKQGRDEFADKANDVSTYPLVKTAKDKKRFELFTKISRKLWKVEAIGLENIDFNETYIFCPNHESHFDGMWILGCLPDKVKNNFCSMAADYLFESKIYRFGIKIMGGIPVQRSANTTIAMKRVYECISKEEKNLLIHPEGTRTRNGELGEFKLGAAELSLGTGVKIIPIYINGAREIFPPDRRLPRILNKGKRLKLQIVFGKPISPEYKSASVITKEIRQQIVDMKNSGGGHDKKQIIFSIINKHSNEVAVNENTRFVEDLGFDSLTMYETITEIEMILGINIAQNLDLIKTIGDLINFANEDNCVSNQNKIEKYPTKRNIYLDLKLNIWTYLLCKIYCLEVHGLENIPKRNYIMCSNHASYFDPIWILSAIGNKNYDKNKLACFAAIHTLKQSKGIFNMLGAIPVDREGNTIPAMKRAQECLMNGYIMIIFPEGKRSRDGSMLDFKNGASKLAIDTGTPIVPIRMEGAFEIFPRNHKLPKIWNWEKKCRYKLKIKFGKPIYPQNYSEQELTDLLKYTIERM